MQKLIFSEVDTAPKSDHIILKSTIVYNEIVTKIKGKFPRLNSAYRFYSKISGTSFILYKYAVRYLFSNVKGHTINLCLEMRYISLQKLKLLDY